MKLLAHRGFWSDPSETNTLAAFERAWAGTFGVETDIRDKDREIVISHDPPGRDGLGLDRFLRTRAAHGAATPLALNIKADGLHEEIARLLDTHSVKNVFVFDMSVPETLRYLRAGLPVFARLSEYEADNPFIDRAAGVWLDAFEREWWTLDTIRALCARGKSVAVVSPELHKRPHEALWRRLKDLEPECLERVLLCTDFPDKAEKAFAS